MMKLKVGDAAPDFSGVDETGKKVSLKDFRGKKLVLYFYPQDNTPSCTNEACSLRDGWRELQREGYEILGVSPDSTRKHTNFINKFDLPFHLLADQDKQVILAYGVWGPKKTFGREYDGVLRTTFVINQQGKIERIIDHVNTKDHANQILEIQ
ncbi:MAG: thioredoxin-dependent thiol peroxidase [Saprospiraceae bacterium]|nr:thioredoxin-dependent thiol peroxidase [Saprospiraceae bacterium]MCB9317747.1 thioredoxin-dependent thiol peroxidase [Lewinellaceae bacterium]